MAGPYTCQSFHYNLPSTNKGEYISGALTTHTNRSGTLIPTLVISRIFTPGRSRAFTPAFAPTPSSKNKLFKQFIKAYLGAQT